MKPAVILKSDFVVSTDKNYSNYVNYIDREGAKNRDKEVQDYKLEDASYEKYLEYMNRSTAKYSNEKEKGEGLFTEDKDLVYNYVIKQKNNITCQYLKNLNFMWNNIDEKYIHIILQYMKKVKFID